MAATAQHASPTLRPGGLDPLRSVWNLLTNVKFALVLVGTAAFAGLLGVVFPQVPGPMRGNPAARSAWLELKRQDYGALTDTMDGLGLFDVFHTAWFNGLWAVIIVSVTVCAVSRFRPTWRSVQQPVKQVGDAYFATAHHRASFSHAGGVEAVEGLLRRRHYRVERTAKGDGGSQVFAERFAWSQYGTFLSHLALLMLLVGALLTRFGGFDRTYVIAEGTPAAPVFDTPGPNQLFVRVVDAVRGRDAAGNIVDFHTQIEVRRGDQVVTCQTSVNDPCHAFGYRVHQAAFFDDIARLRITDPAGRVVYHDVLDFDSQTTAVPMMRVSNTAGAVLFDQALPQMDTDPGASPGREDDVALSSLVFPASVGSTDLLAYVAAWRVIDGQLHIGISGDGRGAVEMKPGDVLSFGDYRVEFVGAQAIPALRIGDMPGSVSADGSATAQMPVDRSGSPYLFVTGVDAENLALEPGKPVTTSSGYTYAFEGRVEASGVSVKRDPGGTFIWVAVGMALVGLAITFYVPRRRLWVKVTEGRMYMAGVAERTTRFSRELRLMGAELGARDALLEGDVERDA